MGYKQIRTGQLITPFGPGSLYTDRNGVPHIICGLDTWHLRYDLTQGFLPCDSLDEFKRFEPRLSRLLGVDSFRCPPDYRTPSINSCPPNSSLTIPALRFPTWYRNTSTSRLRKFNLETVRIDSKNETGRWQPVRFITVCEKGHLSEFPWKEWIDCSCSDDDGLELIDRGGSELRSINVRCTTCPPGSTGKKGRSLSNITFKPKRGTSDKSEFEKSSIRCPGERPWLGERGRQCGCSAPLIGAMINQTNLYFPRTQTSIFIPSGDPDLNSLEPIRTFIVNFPHAANIKMLWRIGDKEAAVMFAQTGLKRAGLDVSDADLQKVLENLVAGVHAAGDDSCVPLEPESEMSAFRRSEFNIIRKGLDDPKNFPDLRVVNELIPTNLKPWISRIALVERLKETKVLYGFDRLEQASDPLANMPESALDQLFLYPPPDGLETWLPCSETFGEGIFLEIHESTLKTWQTVNSAWIRSRLTEDFVRNLAEVRHTLPPLGAVDFHWASRFLVVHTLSHILINQLVYECGYSSASLKERLFVSDDPDAPMAALMIYTASGDSEGTMGGLVNLGRKDSIESVVKRALSRAVWCSTDPVCSENLGGNGASLSNLAACHSCVLIPETACETINNGLDRAMVLGTPENRNLGFFSTLIAHNT